MFVHRRSIHWGRIVESGHSYFLCETFSPFLLLIGMSNIGSGSSKLHNSLWSGGADACDSLHQSCWIDCLVAGHIEVLRDKKSLSCTSTQARCGNGTIDQAPLMREISARVTMALMSSSRGAVLRFATGTARSRVNLPDRVRRSALR